VAAAVMVAPKVAWAARVAPVAASAALATTEGAGHKAAIRSHHKLSFRG